MERIKQYIREAFESAPYPGEHNIALPEIYNSLDGQYVREHLNGRRWTELNLENMVGIYSDFFWWLTPQAIVYYLPAYMTACLHRDEADVMVNHTISQLLEQPSESGWLDLITSQQGMAILRWLVFMLTDEEYIVWELVSRKWLQSFAFWANLRIKNIHTALNNAFPISPHPDDEYLIDPTMRVKRPESELILNAFQGKRWNEISREAIEAFGDTLYYYLTPEAFRYYLPGVMSVCLEKEFDQTRIPAIVEALVPDPDLEPHFEAFVQPLTLLQREVVLRCLCLIFARYAGQQTSQSYRLVLRFWSQP